MPVPKSALVCVLLLSVGLGCALLLWLARDRTLPFSFGVVSYLEQGDGIAAQVVVSNKCSSSVTFHAWDSLQVMVETAKGRATYETSYKGLDRFTIGPRASAVFTVRLPADTVRWQVSGLFRAASPKRRVMQALIQRSPTKVSNWLVRRLPPDVEVKSGIFKVPRALIEGPPNKNTVQPVPVTACSGLPGHAMKDGAKIVETPVRG